MNVFNGCIFMFFALTDEKLLAFFTLETSNDNSLSTDPKILKIPPFDASRHGESNKPLFIFLRLLGDELMRLNHQKKSLPHDF